MTELSGETRQGRPCQRCKKWKPNGDFYANQGNTCKDCINKASKQWRKANPEANRLARRRRHRKNPLARKKSRIKRRYQLSEEQIEFLLKEQDYACAICRTPLLSPFNLDPDAEGTKAVIDHDHSDGHVRGLLCSACNTGLGQFEDNPKIVRAAYYYLKKDRENVRAQEQAILRPDYGSIFE